MKVAVACGGTGGHILPGLSTALYLQHRGHEVELWMTGKEQEKASLVGWEGPVVIIPSAGFVRKGRLHHVSAAVKLAGAVRRARSELASRKPDVVLAMGSYASVGPAVAARMAGLPYVLHEANVIPGRAVKLLSRGAAAVASQFDATRFHLKGVSLEVTGMPLRPDLYAAMRAARSQQMTRAPDAPLHLAVMGGSSGAHRINEIVSEALCRLRPGTLEVTHITGCEDREWVEKVYHQKGLAARVEAFIPDMENVYGRADFILCRAGASTCAEVQGFGLPALMIPYPYAIHNHQLENAAVLEKQHLVDCVEERELTCDWLADYVESLCRKPDKLNAMRTSHRTTPLLNGAENLGQLIEQIVERA